MRAALAVLALAFGAPAFASEAPAWQPVNSETGKVADLDGLHSLAASFPDSGSVRLRLLTAQLKAGEAQAALSSLKWLKERGYVFSKGAQAQIPGLLGKNFEQAARDALISDAIPIATSEVVGSLAPEAGLVEWVTTDAQGSFFTATSITRNALIAQSVNGSEVTLEEIPNASDLSYRVTDEQTGTSWVASANLDNSPDAEPLFTGLIGRGEGASGLKRVPAPEGALVADLAIGADGTVYASDPINGGVYAKPRGASKMQTIVAQGVLRSPQGLAVSADGARLYVSDYRYGLAFVDLESGVVSRLASDAPALLDGVDGLWLHEDELIAVQNGSSPMRISAFRLSKDGTRIASARVLEQAHPGWREPLGGSVVSGALIYVATGQWDRFEKGRLKQGLEPMATVVRRLPLD